MDKYKKRKEQLAEKSKYESFVFNLAYESKKRGLQMNFEDPTLQSELEFLKGSKLVDGFSKLSEFLNNMNTELGITPTADCPQLAGATVPYLLGITSTAPTEQTTLTKLANTHQQLTFRFTNDDRIRLVAWLRENPIEGIEITTRLGQPMLRLPGFNVELKRIVPHFEFITQ